MKLNLELVARGVRQGWLADDTSEALTHEGLARLLGLPCGAASAWEDPSASVSSSRRCPILGGGGLR